MQRTYNAMRWLLPVLLLIIGSSAVQATPAQNCPTAGCVVMNGLVNDQSGVLPTAFVTALDQKLTEVEQQTGAQIAVLVVNSTAPLSVESYAESAFNRWRLGREKIDDGVLLLVALDDRAVRIEVGYGLEGVITDNRAQHIIDTYLIPAFRADNYPQGILQAANALAAYIGDSPLPPPGSTPVFIAKADSGPGIADAVLVILTLIIVGALFLGYKNLLELIPKITLITSLVIFTPLFYFSTFNAPAGNGLTLGNGYFADTFPRWSQELLLHVLPAWISVLWLGLLILLLIVLMMAFNIWQSGKIAKSSMKPANKSRLSTFLMGASFWGLMTFFRGEGLSYSLVSGIVVGGIFALFASGKGGGKGGRGRRGGSSGSSGGSSGGGRSSGGGGRSGGGGASGRW